MADVSTRTLEVPGAVLTYDVRQPAARSGHRPLFILGSPMAASGFDQLVGHFTDRTVITYDPRGAERSALAPDGIVTGEIHGEDMHRVVEDSALGPVDVFGSSGGGAFALHWVVTFPGDVATLVSHEPPLSTILEDAVMAARVNDDIIATYQRDGYGPALAKFIALVMHSGPLPDDYLDRPAPDPAVFGLPTEDDGSRDDPLLSRNLAIPPFVPDLDALRASTVRIVPAIGAEGEGTLARRGGEALARELGVEPVVFPGDHGGFTVSPMGPNNDPAAFAGILREVLDREMTPAGRYAAEGGRVFVAVGGSGGSTKALLRAAGLGGELLRVDLAQVVSKWVGETEKNLTAVFDAAERSGAVLLFDEADALFGQRTEVSGSHDRYANLETANLLGHLEQHPGIPALVLRTAGRPVHLPKTMRVLTTNVVGRVGLEPTTDGL